MLGYKLICVSKRGHMCQLHVLNSHQSATTQLATGWLYCSTYPRVNTIQNCTAFVPTWDQGPFFIPYLEAQVTWIFASKSLDHFLSSLQVTWEPSHLAKSQVTLVADLEISWIAQTSLFVILYIFQFIYVTLYGMFYNICTKGSPNSLHWWIMRSMPPAPTAS